MKQAKVIAVDNKPAKPLPASVKPQRETPQDEGAYWLVCLGGGMVRCKTRGLRVGDFYVSHTKPTLEQLSAKARTYVVHK